MTADELKRAGELWTEISARLNVIEDLDEVERSARDLLAHRTLRGMDAIHLASWIVAAGPVAAHGVFVTLDKQLRLAAEAEGATVLPATLP